MTTPATSLTDPAAPPAEERSTTVLTETTHAVHVVDVPLIALIEGDVIRRHPVTDEDVVWRVVTWETGDTPSVTYKTSPDGEHLVHGFDGPMPWVTVQAPDAGVSR